LICSMSFTEAPTPTTTDITTASVGLDTLTLHDVAVILNLSDHGVANMAARGEIPGAHKFGRRWRVSRIAFENAYHGGSTRS
jgi:excisionase family DNA binding protein